MEAERATSRGGFIKRVGMLAAIGLGVALVPAQQAQASGAYCCRDPECGANACAPYGDAYKCTDNCTGTTCCVGCPPWTGCQQRGCIC